MHEDTGRLARLIEIARGDVVLRGIEWSGAEPAIVLLHGLAGHAGEWLPVVDRLDRQHRVVAFDQRGHGRSTRAPHDMSRFAHADDVASVIWSVAAAPVTLVGHSLGGHTAMLTAARYRDLVDRLVMIEASPGGPNPTAAADAARWLTTWPVPFPTCDAAVDFFGGGTAGRAWAAGLAMTEDGLRPRFDTATVLRALDEITVRPWWDVWETVICQTLVMSGASGWLSDDDAEGMTRTGPRARVVKVADAGHDVHLDQPAHVAENIIDCDPLAVDRGRRADSVGHRSAMVEIHSATTLPSRAVTEFDSSNANWTAVARSDSACHVGRMRIEAGGVVGIHATRLDQLFIVVDGYGWVQTRDGPRRGVSAGQVVVWRAGEEHESGTDSGVTAIVAQASQFIVGE